MLTEDIRGGDGDDGGGGTSSADSHLNSAARPISGSGGVPPTPPNASFPRRQNEMPRGTGFKGSHLRQADGTKHTGGGFLSAGHGTYQPAGVAPTPPSRRLQSAEHRQRLVTPGVSREHEAVIARAQSSREASPSRSSPPGGGVNSDQQQPYERSARSDRARNGGNDGFPLDDGRQRGALHPMSGRAASRTHPSGRESESLGSGVGVIRPKGIGLKM